MTDTTPTQEPTPTPAPAPTPAPVPQPTPAPTQEPTPTPEPTPVDYSGDSVIETSINVFASSHGIKPDVFADAVKNALIYKDENLIDYNAITQGLKGAAVEQAKALAKAAFTEQTKYLDSQKSAVFVEAGGEENWKQAAAAFNAKAPDYLRATIRTMLDGGDMVNAAKTVMEYVTRTGLVVNGTPPIQGGNGSGGDQGLSYAEYRDELAKLMKESGNRSLETGTNAEKLKSLNARRALGKQQGR